MSIIEKTSAALVVQYRPWLESLVGVLFAGAGAWAFLAGERVFGGGFVVAGATIVVVFANTVTSRFDRTTGRFTRSMKGAVRSSVVTHLLADIASVRVEASGGSSSSPSQSYRVVLVLKSRERVPVSSGLSSGKSDKEQVAAEIRAFLNLERSEDPPGFGEMVNAMFGSQERERER